MGEVFNWLPGEGIYVQDLAVGSMLLSAVLEMSVYASTIVYDRTLEIATAPALSNNKRGEA